MWHSCHLTHSLPLSHDIASTPKGGDSSSEVTNVPQGTKDVKGREPALGLVLQPLLYIAPHRADRMKQPPVVASEGAARLWPHRAGFCA